MKTLLNDCFAEELLVKTNELETQRKEMLNHGVEFTLHDIVDKIQSHETEINKAMAQYRMTKQALQTMVANIIVEATDGRVRVPHYSPCKAS